MLLRRNFSIALLCVWLASCQWSPVYAPMQAGADMPSIAIESPAHKHGRYVRQWLEDALPNAQTDKKTAQLILTISPAFQLYPTGIEDDGEASRFNVVASTSYQLKDAGNVLAKGTLKRIASYSVVDSDFATYLAREEAQQRALTMLAEGLRDRMILALKSRPQ